MQYDVTRRDKNKYTLVALHYPHHPVCITAEDLYELSHQVDTFQTVLTHLDRMEYGELFKALDKVASFIDDPNNFSTATLQNSVFYKLVLTPRYGHIHSFTDKIRDEKGLVLPIY